MLRGTLITVMGSQVVNHTGDTNCMSFNNTYGNGTTKSTDFLQQENYLSSESGSEPIINRQHNWSTFVNTLSNGGAPMNSGFPRDFQTTWNSKWNFPNYQKFYHNLPQYSMEMCEFSDNTLVQTNGGHTTSHQTGRLTKDLNGTTHCLNGNIHPRLNNFYQGSE